MEWNIHTTAQIQINNAKPLESLDQLRIRYPDRVWEATQCPQIGIEAHRANIDARNKPPKGLTLEETHAIAHWVQANKWTPLHDDEQRPVESIIGHYQCTYFEAALALEIDTDVKLGGPKADWATKANLMRIGIRNIHSTFDLRLESQRNQPSFKQLFDARIRRCARDVTGLWLHGLGRRPLWQNGIAVEHAITIKLHFASQHFDSCGGSDDRQPIKCRGQHFGKNFIFPPNLLSSNLPGHRLQKS